MSQLGVNQKKRKETNGQRNRCDFKARKTRIKGTTAGPTPANVHKGKLIKYFSSQTLVHNFKLVHFHYFFLNKLLTLIFCSRFLAYRSTSYICKNLTFCYFNLVFCVKEFVIILPVSL